MPRKDLVISLLKEKQSQLMEQYAELEDLQGEFSEYYGLFQLVMDNIDEICEEIRRRIYGLEVDDGKQEI